MEVARMDSKKLEKEIKATILNIERANKIKKDVLWEIQINEFMLNKMKAELEKQTR